MDLWCHMLAHQSSHREDAGPAVAAGTGGPAHLGEGARAGIDGRGDGLVVDDVTVADDHGIPLVCRRTPEPRRCRRGLPNQIVPAPAQLARPAASAARNGGCGERHVRPPAPNVRQRHLPAPPTDAGERVRRRGHWRDATSPVPTSSSPGPPATSAPGSPPGSPAPAPTSRVVARQPRAPSTRSPPGREAAPWPATSPTATALRGLVARVEAGHRPVDLLVNNAAVEVTAHFADLDRRRARAGCSP